MKSNALFRRVLVPLVAVGTSLGLSTLPAYAQTANATGSFARPSLGQVFSTTDRVMVVVNANDRTPANNAGSIQQVSLFLDGESVRTDREAPFRWGRRLTNLSAGDHELRAEITDNNGQVSSINTSFIVERVLQAPIGSFSQPPLGEIFEPGDQVVVGVDASDADGSVSEVALFIDDVLVRRDTDAPYFWPRSRLLREAGVGTHVLRAEITDSDNQVVSIENTFEVASSTESDTVLETEEDVVRFLNFASLGADMDTVRSLVGTDAADWLEAEFDKPATDIIGPIRARFDQGERINRGAVYPAIHEGTFTGSDQLRQRMVLALAEIFVVSQRGLMPNNAPELSVYVDMLHENAFGNYRDLLENVSLSTAMSIYLTYLCNDGRGDPDENYAREIMQLFSIGLTELRQNGTPRLDSDGNEIETYDNNDIVGLARVFTGFGVQGPRCVRSSRTRTALFEPLTVFPDLHSRLEKNFLSTRIPAGTGARRSLTIALDALASHRNTAPFISRQLIQRFTASDPTPAYVSRVADAFDSGSYTASNGTTFGSSERGDFKAVLAAILLDQNIHSPRNDRFQRGGKLREPMMKLYHWARAFNVEVSDPRVFELRREPMDTGLGQGPLDSPSVFNFFRPGYVRPNSVSAELGQVAPELQIVDENAVLNYINYMSRWIFDDTRIGRPGRRPSTGFTPDYSGEIAIASDPAALVDRLNLLLTANQMNSEEIEAVNDLVETVALVDRPNDLRRRVEVAIQAIMSTPSFSVLR